RSAAAGYNDPPRVSVPPRRRSVRRRIFPVPVAEQRQQAGAQEGQEVRQDVVSSESGGRSCSQSSCPKANNSQDRHTDMRQPLVPNIQNEFRRVISDRDMGEFLTRTGRISPLRLYKDDGLRDVLRWPVRD